MAVSPASSSMIDQIVEVNLIDARDGSARVRRIALSDLGYDRVMTDEDTDSIERGTWVEVCLRRGIVSAGKSRQTSDSKNAMAARIAQLLLKGASQVAYPIEPAPAQSQYAVAKTFSGSLKGIVCAEAVLMWWFEEEHPCPWDILRDATAEYSKVSKVPTGWHNAFTQGLDAFKNEIPASKRICAGCGNGCLTKLQVCSGCGVTRFCSRECEKDNWPTHKGLCRQLAKRKEAQRRLNTEHVTVKDVQRCARRTQVVDDLFAEDDIQTCKRSWHVDTSGLH